MSGLGAPHPLTVCLVEDHERVRHSLVALLEGAGLSVCAAVATAEESLAAVRVHDPHVAVLDSRLPDGTGIDLCRALTRELPGVAVVIHAGTVDEDLEVAAQAAGASAVVPKSIRGTALLESLGALRRAGAPPR